jgi:hypothetical protein
MRQEMPIAGCIWSVAVLKSPQTTYAPRAGAAADLDVLLNETVPLPVAAYLRGESSAHLMYCDVREGLITLAKPSPSGRKRVSLRALSEFGVNVSPEAVAAAERAFARDIKARNDKLRVALRVQS